MSIFSQKQAKILNVKVDVTSKSKVLRFIRFNLKDWNYKLSNKDKFLICTPNPEQIILSQNDDVFNKILNTATISLPDGIGIIAAKRFLDLPTSSNLFLKPIQYFAQGLGVGFSVLFDKDWLMKDFELIKGREFFIDIVKLANKKGWKLFLIGDRSKSAQKASEVLSFNYKRLKIYSESGPNLDLDANPQTDKDSDIEKKLIKKINEISPHILFIGFGAPKQEKWMYRWYKKLNIGGAMAVGSTFDYIYGKAKNTPTWISDSGLEWIWRLLTGSQKTKRIVKAFPIFPIKVFWQKLRS